jgi:sterol desaturase/sphingolipid hydroxylase (fatty acid hydroxylase superfamily)
MSTLTLNDYKNPASPALEASMSRPQAPGRADSSPISSNKSHAQKIVIAALLVLAVGCLAVLLLHQFPSVGAHLRKLIAGRSMVAVTVYPIAVLFICTLEYWFPAVPNQKILSVGFMHDALWALLQGVLELVVLSWYGMALARFYTQHLSFLTLPVSHSMPLVVKLVIGALALDLIRWWQHWVHHRLIFLWPFHAVHHSQPEINLFSNSRIHVVELLVSSALVTLPMLMLNVPAPAAIWWMLLLTWHARLCHANIKSDFGPLRYVFVTPQSHRVHHSNLAEHFDQNYGAVLSIWDQLFGTQCRRYDVYPTTGVDDKNFPVEKAETVFGLLTSPLRQMLYPFQRLWIKRNPAAIESLARYHRASH